MKQPYVFLKKIILIILLVMLIEIKECVSLNIFALRAKFIQSNCFPIGKGKES